MSARSPLQALTLILRKPRRIVKSGAVLPREAWPVDTAEHLYRQGTVNKKVATCLVQGNHWLSSFPVLKIDFWLPALAFEVKPQHFPQIASSFGLPTQQLSNKQIPSGNLT